MTFLYEAESPSAVVQEAAGHSKEESLDRTNPSPNPKIPLTSFVTLGGYLTSESWFSHL